MSATWIQTSRQRYGLALATVLVAAVAAAMWWWPDQGAEVQATVAPSTASGMGAWPLSAQVGSSGASPLPEVVGDARPADFSQADWDALNRALANEPNQSQERTRLVSYLRFQRAVAQWREWQSGPVTSQRQSLARDVVAQLPGHVANGEVHAGEALTILASLAPDIEPDPTRRTAWLDEQKARMQATQTEAQAQALKAEKAKNEDFAAQEAVIVARWQSTPEASRDPVTLENQLQALREKVYGPPTP